MGNAIVITSGKGGVGKTAITANVGSALALLGKKVCLVDTDIGLRNLDVVLGLENRIIYDIVDVAEQRCSLSAALIRDKRIENLYLLAAAQTKDKNAVTPEQVKQIIGELKQQFDFVIVDCPAGISQGFENAIHGADQAIIVTTPETPAVRDAHRVLELLNKHGLRSRLIINRIRIKMVRSGEMLEIDEICRILALTLLGVVPDDESVIKGSNAGEPAVFDETSRCAVAYRNIARRILGDTVPFMQLEEYDGVMGKFRKFLGAR